MAEIELALAGQTVPLSTLTESDTMETLTTGRYIVSSSARAAQLGIIGGSLGFLDVYLGVSYGVATYYSYSGTIQHNRTGSGAAGWGDWVVLASR